MDVILIEMKLSLSGIPAMLSGGVIGISLDLKRRDYPVFDYVPPSGYPDEDIAKGWLDLLEVHVKR